MPEIQRLMGSLCFTRRQTSTPYADLNSPAQWDDVTREFARQCCGLLGQVSKLSQHTLLQTHKALSMLRARHFEGLDSLIDLYLHGHVSCKLCYGRVCIREAGGGGVERGGGAGHIGRRATQAGGNVQVYVQKLSVFANVLKA